VTFDSSFIPSRRLVAMPISMSKFVGEKAPMLNSTNVYGLLREALMLNSCSFPIGINWKYTVELYVPIEKRDVA